MATAEFLAERLSGVGGSDQADVFSLDYGCRRHGVLAKRGVVPDHPLRDPVLKRGTALEDLVAAEYAERTGRTIEKVGLIRHPVHTELMVHCDRLIEDDSNGPGVLECKTAGREIFTQFRREGLSESYILQLQHALHVTGRRWGSFAVLHPDSWRFLAFDVIYRADLGKYIQAESLRFWDEVQAAEGNKEPLPARLDPRDRRCQKCEYRTSCQGKALLEAIDSGAPSDQVEQDDGLLPLVEEYVAARDAVKEAEAEQEEVHERLGKAIGGRQALDVRGARVYYRVQESMRWDTKALEIEHPELVAKYKRKQITRPLRVYAT
jgi:predicted phage-related endonuclease